MTSGRSKGKRHQYLYNLREIYRNRNWDTELKGQHKYTSRRDMDQTPRAVLKDHLQYSRRFAAPVLPLFISAGLVSAS